MNKHQIEKKVAEIFSKKLSVDEAKINSATTMIDIRADSLDRVEIIMQIEEEFAVIIPDDVAGSIQNIGNICEYIEKAIIDKEQKK